MTQVQKVELVSKILAMCQMRLVCLIFPIWIANHNSNLQDVKENNLFLDEVILRINSKDKKFYPNSSQDPDFINIKSGFYLISDFDSDEVRLRFMLNEHRIIRED